MLAVACTSVVSHAAFRASYEQGHIGGSEKETGKQEDKGRWGCTSVETDGGDIRRSGRRERQEQRKEGGFLPQQYQTDESCVLLGLFKGA